MSDQTRAPDVGEARSGGGGGRRPRRHPAVVWEPLGPEVTMFRPGSTEGHILNPSASVIWQGCDGSRGVEDLVDLVTGRYGIDRERAHADVADCLDRFRSLGLLADETADERPDLDA